MLDQDPPTWHKIEYSILIKDCLSLLVNTHIFSGKDHTNLGGGKNKNKWQSQVQIVRFVPIREAKFQAEIVLLLLLNCDKQLIELILLIK